MPTTSAAHKTRDRPTPDAPPLLVNGDRLDQPEFHRRYLQYPEDSKFELIGGTVFMASPLSLPHSHYDDELGFLLSLYRRATPGVEALHNATAILGPQSEPQPDLGLRILPEYGGQSKTTDEYVVGAPELVAEISYSRRAIDLHGKYDDYKRAGVVEYLVVSVEDAELLWFHLPDETQLTPNKAGVVRSRVFPGLWISPEALMGRDSTRAREVAEQGMASRAHAGFVRRLARQKRASS